MLMLKTASQTINTLVDINTKQLVLKLVLKSWMVKKLLNMQGPDTLCKTMRVQTMLELEDSRK